MKTGITAGWSGATGAFGVQPDLVALAKCIGGGLPLGAFGGTREYMDTITAGKVLHLGTYNGNPLCMAAAKAVLGEVLHAGGDAGDDRRSTAACSIAATRRSRRAGLPAHTVQFGAKGCVTWAPEPIRNYRDYKATDFDLAFAQWIHGINRGVLLPPGLDEQWLISVMHTEADAMHYADVFDEFVGGVRPADRADRLNADRSRPTSRSPPAGDTGATRPSFPTMVGRGAAATLPAVRWAGSVVPSLGPQGRPLPHVRLRLEPQHRRVHDRLDDDQHHHHLHADLRRAARDDDRDVPGAAGGRRWSIVLVGIAVVVPLVIHPITYTLWLAIDLAMRPPSPDELADADAHAPADAAKLRVGTDSRRIANDP